MREKQLINGMSKTKPYNVWCNMIARCKRKTHRRYGDWGGRGIGVCEEWLKFENFWNDMKDGYSDGLSIDRIDNDGDYNLKNCRWATAKQQANNTRKTKKGQ